MALTDWIFGRQRAPVVEERAVIDRTPIGQPPGGAQAYISTYADTGRTITPENARESPTVYACTRLISQSIARMEWRVMRREGGISMPAREHPLYALLNIEPNSYMGAMVWRESMLLDCLLYGNAYSVIERDASGTPIGLHKLRADSVEITRGEDGSPLYTYNSALSGARSRASQVWHGYDIFHLRAPSLDGLLGETPIYLVRNIIGVELEAERYVASFFRNGARPAGLIKVTGTLTEEALKRLRQSWQAVTGGAENAGRVAILESGYDWQSVSVNPEEAKLVELRSYCRSQIASAFNVPVHMVGDASKTSYASAEQGNSEFVQHCLSNWASRFEEECARKLIRQNEEIDTQISFDAMLRGDLSSRFSAYSVALNNGFLTINEVREREQYAPIDGGDVARAPVNLAIVDPNVGKPGDPSQIGQPPAAPGMEAAPGPIASIGPEASAEPVSGAVAGGEPVANTALNGAQVSSLVALASKVKTGEIPKRTAIAIAKAAFPAIDATLIESMFAPIDEGTFDNQATAVAPVPAQSRARRCKSCEMETLAAFDEKTRSCIERKIPILLDEGYDRDQAIAVAIAKCEEGRSVRDCGTGAGGFKPGNDCAGGGDGGDEGDESDGDDGGSVKKNSVPLEDKGKKSEVETEDGRKIDVIEVGKHYGEYINLLYDDSKKAGIATEFNEVRDLQDYDAEPDENVISAYVGAAYPLLTGQGDASEKAWDAIETYGAEDYGTIDYDTVEQIVNEKMDEARKEWDELNKQTWIDEDWDSLSDDDKDGKREEWLDERYQKIQADMEQQKDDARATAMRDMTVAIERDTASSTLACCIQLMRGMRLSPERLDKIIREGSITHTAVNSWTSSGSTAADFSKGAGGVILVTRSPRAGWVNGDNIGGLDEDEVIRPPSTMRIAKIVKSEDGTTFLFLDEDPDYKD
jgi:HK97 family phage portal protein